MTENKRFNGSDGTEFYNKEWLSDYHKWLQNLQKDMQKHYANEKRMIRRRICE